MASSNQGLRTIYLEYVACLNAKSYHEISRFVTDGVIHNGKELGRGGYVQLIKDSFETYPWLHFNIEMLVVDEIQQTTAARIILKGTDPEATDVPREHIFYKFQDGKISEAWSMLDGFGGVEKLAHYS